MEGPCHYCGRPILKADLVWAEREVCRRTHSSPAEIEDVPLHRACRDVEEFDDDGHDAAWSRALQRDPDMREAS